MEKSECSLETGDKLVVLYWMFDGGPDNYIVVEDEAGNLWGIEPGWLHKMDPE
jgi:hypothetical protein